MSLVREDFSGVIDREFSISCSECADLISGDSEAWVADKAIKDGWTIRNRGTEALCRSCAAQPHTEGGVGE